MKEVGRKWIGRSMKLLVQLGGMVLRLSSPQVTRTG